MTRGRLTEDSFIKSIGRRFGRLAPPAPAGIGDDAAILRGRRSGSTLVSVDCLIESTHFRRDEPPYFLGRRSLAVNLSDITAMGGSPTGFFLTLGIPRDLPHAYLERFLDGVVSAAREHRVPILGGDTSRSPRSFFVSITILGAVGGRRVLTRGGARPGDGIYVTGPLGVSATGRLLLETGFRPRLDASRRRVAGVTPPSSAAARAKKAGLHARTLRARARQAISCHLNPSPRIRIGRALLEKGIASAAMDISDGLSLDLTRMAEASRAGARLIEQAIPIGDAPRALGRMLGRDPLALALDGGEDYELLFTVPASRERRLHESGLPFFFIGRIENRRAGLTIGGPPGARRPLNPAGFDHFR